MTKIPVRRKRVPKEVNLGLRKTNYRDNNETLEKHLAVGRNLRKSNTYPIKCRVILNRVWKMSKEQIETINRNRKKMKQEGTLPPSVPVKEWDPYQSHWDPYPAIIPRDGITKEGYVKEVWIKSYGDSIEIDNQSYTITDPYAHDSEKWIQGFMLESDVFLLPHSKIVVKYYHKE